MYIPVWSWNPEERAARTVRALRRLERPLGFKLQTLRRVTRRVLGPDRYYRHMLHQRDPTAYRDFDYYDRRDYAVDKSEFEDIVRELDAFGAKVRTVLDVGCGTGLLSARLREAGFAVTGADFDTRALAYCLRRGIPCVQADARRLPFPDASFDATVTQHLIEHCDPPRAAALDALRVARVGSVHVVPGHESDDVTHIVPYFTEPVLQETFADLDARWRPDAHSSAHPEDLDYVAVVRKAGAGAGTFIGKERIKGRSA